MKAHSPHIILITPPPFEESVLKQLQEDWGYTGETRKAKDSAEYAEIVREVGKETGLSVLDIWSAFMDKAGWHAGDSLPIPGSIELGRSAALAELMYDGECCGIRVVRVNVLANLNIKGYISVLKDTKSPSMR